MSKIPDNNAHDQCEKAMSTFLREEIRGSLKVAEFFLQWLLDDNSHKSTSGDAFFLEKNFDKVIIGNLFDESFSETEVSKIDLVNFIKMSVKNLA